MDKKKRIEFSYLDGFLSLLGTVPSRIICGESPDFVVAFEQRKIGVEVTDFYSDSEGRKGSQRRAMEENWASLQGMIMGKVKECNELKDTNGLLFFKKQEVPPGRAHGEFTDELIKLSREMINSDCREIEPGSNYSLLSKYLKRFRLEKCGFYMTWEWNHNVLSIGVTETMLIKTVESKILTDYKGKDIDEVWLLIISGFRLPQALGMHLSYKLSTFSRLNNLLGKSGYSKVYLYQHMLDVLYRWPGWAKTGRESLA
ncbi:MAG TPA: hypothetical protein ENI23_17990 [bacterium]|nr:hypothetical protein [bacterium]